jgi:hypothetical protein
MCVAPHTIITEYSATPAVILVAEACGFLCLKFEDFADKKI